VQTTFRLADPCRRLTVDVRPSAWLTDVREYPPLLPLYSWRNTGTFANYGDRKLGAKWAVAAYYMEPATIPNARSLPQHRQIHGSVASEKTS
jgi:hypothetical protein